MYDSQPKTNLIDHKRHLKYTVFKKVDGKNYLSIDKVVILWTNTCLGKGMKVQVLLPNHGLHCDHSQVLKLYVA